MQNQVAITILEQLGNNKFMIMTGAKMLVAMGPSEDADGVYRGGLMFSIGRGAKNGANKVVIKLDSTDTYNVEFFKIRGTDVKTLPSYTGVYGDKLQEVFTRETGFDTHL